MIFGRREWSLICQSDSGSEATGGTTLGTDATTSPPCTWWTCCGSDSWLQGTGSVGSTRPCPRTPTPWPTWTRTSPTTWSTRSPSRASPRSGSGARPGVANPASLPPRPLTWWVATYWSKKDLLCKGHLFVPKVSLIWWLRCRTKLFREKIHDWRTVPRDYCTH